MGGTAKEISLAEGKSALAWWLDAGVDVAVGESPRNWLKPAPRSPAPATAVPAAPAVEPSPAHHTLEQFRLWLETSDSLHLGGTTARRVLPRGSEQAAVMLIAEMPSAEDAAAGQPLSGECWQLAQAMLAAVGIADDDIYCAALSCFHAPGAKLRGAELDACAEIAREHVRLARPRRLLLLGEAPCRALLGKGLLEARGHAHKVEGVPAVATFHPRHLIHRTLDKPRAWEDLLLMMEADA